MMRVRCMMMQRNQTRHLEAWFRYHGHLFGFEHLTVFDNGSNDRATVETLRRYGRAGSVISWHHKSDDDFASRHDIFEQTRRSWTADGYDLAIGLECDEFVTVFTETGLSARRDAIEAEVGRLRAGPIEVGLALRAAGAGTPGLYALETISRALMPSGALVDGSPQPTELALLRVAGRSDGRRRTDPVLVGLPELTRLAAALGIDAQVFGTASPGDGPVLKRGRSLAPFDGQAYLAANRDVQAARWPALKHFLMLGHREKRRLAPRVSRP